MKLTESIEEFSSYGGPKIIYHESYRDKESLLIEPNGILNEGDLKHLDINFDRFNGMPVLFRDKSEFGFDIFSATFFMLSRYEEYLPFRPDKHGRFSAENSIAFSNGFLETPVVDCWVDYLKRELKKKFPELKFQQSQFDALFTYDIDLAFKYRGRSFFRSLGGFVKDIAKLNFSNVRDRLGVLLKWKTDPWDVDQRILKTIQDSKVKSLFFFPAGARSDFDKNLSPHQPAVSHIIKKIKSRSQVGLHPSYYSSQKPELFLKEKIVLEKEAEDTISASRQHFLKFKLPDTYLTLLEIGISRDYSMTFADMPGFRAGTSRAFYFYNFKNEGPTALQIFPPCCMDSTFIHYLKYDAAKALQTMESLMKTIHKFDGIFIPIFHNHCLENEEWNSLHAGLINKAKMIKQENTIEIVPAQKIH